ncbi:MAG: ABC transporter ATP-binding protein [Eubacterium sp.]|nr:ABC transporter ATP-binding protein [Eubacterium sp.]
MIKVEDIKKSFSGHHVLKGVSFEVADGSIYGLIGKNGAGKTTLMNIMTGLLKADAGSCCFLRDGNTQNAGNKNAKAGKSNQLKIGFLPDLPAFYEYLTTDEYIDFLYMDSDVKRRNELLEMVDLPSGVKIKTMSRGMRQRLGIAGVLVGDPDVIMMDEPTSALDPSGRNDVKNILMHLKNQGKTIILSTHILADMDSICDKAGFLSNGVIVKEVDVKDSKKNVSEIEVIFASKPDLDQLYRYAPKIILMNPKDPRIIKIEIDENDHMNSQQSALQGLATLKQEIISIKSSSVSLDSIFQEVCV